MGIGEMCFQKQHRAIHGSKAFPALTGIDKRLIKVDDQAYHVAPLKPRQRNTKDEYTDENNDNYCYDYCKLEGPKTLTQHLRA
ncbi:hypothetical protein PYJP_00920 [Pyrofollis japonicus]|nr:hypothetical protein PYJP_00920 [Pyrofollis japonicus]